MVVAKTVAAMSQYPIKTAPDLHAPLVAVPVDEGVELLEGVEPSELVSFGNVPLMTTVLVPFTTWMLATSLLWLARMGSR